MAAGTDINLHLNLGLCPSAQNILNAKHGCIDVECAAKKVGGRGLAPQGICDEVTPLELLAIRRGGRGTDKAWNVCRAMVFCLLVREAGRRIARGSGR
jgi:hypothetical protein